MKKLVILVMCIASLLSCSSDDDTGQSLQDPIVGKWYLFDIQINGTSVISDNCLYRSFIELNANNSSDGEYYQNSSGSCQLVPVTYPDWTNLGDSVYRFVVPMFGLQTGEVEFVGSSKFNFTSDDFPSGTVVIFSTTQVD